MTTFYVPIEDDKPDLTLLQRWFFLVVDAPTASKALVAAMHEFSTFRMRGALWTPVRKCPSVDHMQALSDKFAKRLAGSL